MIRFLLSYAVAFIFLAQGITFGSYMLVADSRAEFSGVQGQNSWYYGYYDGQSATPYSNGDFKQFQTYGTTDIFGPNAWYKSWDGAGLYFTHLNQSGGHPHTRQATHWAVRRWVSEVSGTVKLTGLTADDISYSWYDGTVARIIVDGTERWSRVILNDTSLQSFEIEFNVGYGSLVDFALDPRSNDGDDWTRFEVQVYGASAVPEPTTVTLWSLSLMGITYFRHRSKGFRGRRRC